MDAPSPSSQQNSRTTGAILLLIACCLLSSGRMLFKSPRPAKIKPDGIAARSDSRFALLKKLLPAEGVVGYIGENGDDAVPDYYLTQYALAPLVVDHSTQHAIVIGNFPTWQSPEIPPDLRVVQDFGSGVMLLANKDAK